MFARSVYSDGPSKLFLVSSLFFGILFILLVPPFQIPDELTHFTRAYETSEFKSARVQHRKGEVDHLGSMLPRSILLTHKATRLHLTPGYPDVAAAKKFHMGQTKAALNIPLNKSDRIFFDTGSSPQYFPLLYIPQAFTIAVLQFFNSPIVLMIYATRLVGLLLWVAFGLLALKILKPTTRRWAMAGVLLLPMFVSQASTSTDPMINGLLVLYLALVSRHYLRKTAPTPRVTVVMIVMLSMMSLSKPVYAVFGLLYALLPHWRKTGRLYTAVVVAAPAAIFVIWSALAKYRGAPFFIDSISVSHAQPSLQAHHVIPNVFNFVEPFVNTLFLGWGDNILVSMIGEFGKLDTPLPVLFVVLGFVVIIAALFVGTNEKEEAELTRSYYRKPLTRVAVSLIILAYVVGVYLAMYVYSTPPNELIVTGVQGRYLLPLLPLLLLFGRKSTLTAQPLPYRRFMVVAPQVLLAFSILVVYLRFYAVYP